MTAVESGELIGTDKHSSVREQYAQAASTILKGTCAVARKIPGSSTEVLDVSRQETFPVLGGDRRSASVADDRRNQVGVTGVDIIQMFTAKPNPNPRPKRQAYYQHQSQSAEQQAHQSARREQNSGRWHRGQRGRFVRNQARVFTDDPRIAQQYERERNGMRQSAQMVQTTEREELGQRETTTVINNADSEVATSTKKNTSVNNVNSSQVAHCSKDNPEAQE